MPATGSKKVEIGQQITGKVGMLKKISIGKRVNWWHVMVSWLDMKVTLSFTTKDRVSFTSKQFLNITLS